MWNQNYSHNNGFQQGCGCGNTGYQFPAQPCPPAFPPCGPNNGCPILLDSACVIYHKYNNQISGLTNLGLNNGATAELIFNTIDVQLGYIDVANWALPNLRDLGYTLNTLPQFGAAVDEQIGLINADIAALQSLANTPITPVDSLSIDLTVSGILNHTLRADLVVDNASGNTLIVTAGGVSVPAQTLSIDYTAKTLHISQGNTVDFSSLLCQTGFIGNVNADPSGAIDGDYWWRTDLSAASALKIKVGGTVRTIATT